MHPILDRRDNDLLCGTTCLQRLGPLGQLSSDGGSQSAAGPGDPFTANLFETQVLAGVDEITTVDQLKDAARRIHDHGVPAVLAKAGTLLGTGTALDVFYDGQTMEVLEVPAVGSERVSGAGCTLAAAITAELAKGAEPLQACRTAKQVVVSAIENRMHGKAPFDYAYQGCYTG